MNDLAALSVLSLLLGVIAGIVVAIALWWILMATLIRGGRRRRAERLADSTAYAPVAPRQDWYGKQS